MQHSTPQRTGKIQASPSKCTFCWNRKLKASNPSRNPQKRCTPAFLVLRKRAIFPDHRRLHSFSRECCYRDVKQRMHFSTLRSLRLSIILGSFFCVLLLASGRTSLSQQKSANSSPSRLPSADRVVGDYLKVLGGKKRVSAIRDATYEWTSQQQADGTAGAARTELSSPSSLRMSIRVDKSERQAGVSPSSVWQKSDDGTVHTITGKTAADTRLRALLF